MRAGRGGGQRHLRNPLWHRTERGWASSPTAPGSTHGCARARRVERLVGTPVHARMHACAAARITRAVPAHDPSPPRRHAHRARPAAGARACRRARHARERARRTDRARPRGARALTAEGRQRGRARLARSRPRSFPTLPPPPAQRKKKFFQGHFSPTPSPSGASSHTHAGEF